MLQVKGSSYLSAPRYRDTRELLKASVDLYGKKDAYVFRRQPQLSPEHRSFDELGQDVEALGTWLVHHLEGNPHLALIGKNSYEWIVSHFAILNGAGVSVPLDRQLPAREIRILLEQGDCEALIYSPELHDEAVSCAGTLPDVKTFIVMDPVDPDAVPEKLPERFVKLSEVLAEGRRLLAEDDRRYAERTLSEDEVAAIYFTSGTTSAAKGVMLSQRNITANIHSIASTVEIFSTDRFLSVLPLHHTFENTIGVFVVVSQGTSTYFMDGLRYLSDNLAEFKVTCLIGVPLLFEGIYRKIMKEIERKGKTDLIRRAAKVSDTLGKLGIDVRRKLFREVLDGLGGAIRMMVVGAAPADLEVIKGYNSLGIDFYQGYGLTEHTPVVSVETKQVRSWGSVGMPLANVEVAIASNNDAFGEENQGEILVRSESVMLGYYKQPQLTAEVIDADGWLHTGDMGFIDRKKTIHITGRIKSMIVLANGKKAFPEEIEQLLGRIPGVGETMAWGEANARDAVDICARIELKPEELPAEVRGDDEKIAEYLRLQILEVNHQMPSYKAVKYFIFSDDPMVRTTTLKVKRTPELARIHNLLEMEGKTMRELDGQRASFPEVPAQ